MTMMLMGIETPFSAGGVQLKFFENFQGHYGAALSIYSTGILSVHAVAIPNSISFNNVVILMSETNAGSYTAQFGLYTINAGTLSLANSANVAVTNANTASWRSMATSATQNITPGQYYFALNFVTAGNSRISMLQNSSNNPANAVPGGFGYGRMTVTTNAMPGSIATTDLDITGSDAIRQPYIIITV